MPSYAAAGNNIKTIIVVLKHSRENGHSVLVREVLENSIISIQYTILFTEMFSTKIAQGTNGVKITEFRTSVNARVVVAALALHTR